MSEENHSPEQIYKVAVIAWASFFGSQFVLLFLLYVLKPDVLLPSAHETIGNPVPIVVLSIAAVICLFLSFVLRRWFENQALMNEDVKRAMSATMLASALAESAAVIGFVVVFSFSFRYAALFILAGIAAAIAHFPSRSKYHQAAGPINRI